LRQGLRFFLIVPKIWLERLLLHIGQLTLELVQVKDSRRLSSGAHRVGLLGDTVRSDLAA